MTYHEAVPKEQVQPKTLNLFHRVQDCKTRWKVIIDCRGDWRPGLAGMLVKEAYVDSWVGEQIQWRVCNGR